MRFLLMAPLVLVLLISCNSNKQQKTTESNTTEAKVSDAQPKGGITIEELDEKYANYEKAYFAGGCFWCTEAVFHRIEGVKDVYSGYSGGKEDNPTYKEVSYGKTTHAESIVVYYDSAIITYETLLDVFFFAHDPTTLNRQGPDIGPHYRSAIFFLNEAQEKAALAKIKSLNDEGVFQNPIVTQVEEASAFYIAEAYHQDYYEDFSNPNQSYVQNITRPKVEKALKHFANIIKPEFKQKN